jgi:hypothetical protein
MKRYEFRTAEGTVQVRARNPEEADAAVRAAYPGAVRVGVRRGPRRLLAGIAARA